MNTIEKYDKIIIGAGLYGLYAALHCGRKGQKVCGSRRDAVDEAVEEERWDQSGRHGA